MACSARNDRAGNQAHQETDDPAGLCGPGIVRPGLRGVLVRFGLDTLRLGCEDPRLLVASLLEQVLKPFVRPRGAAPV